MSSSPAAMWISSSVPTIRSQSGSTGLQMLRHACRSGCSAPRPRRGRRGPRGSAGSRCRRRPCRPAARAMRIAFRCAAVGVRLGEMRAGDDDGAGGADEVLVDVGFGQRHVGAVLAVEEQREGACRPRPRGWRAPSAAPDRPCTPSSATPSRVSCSRMKRPNCSSPTPVMRPHFRPSRAAPMAMLVGRAADRFREARDVLQARADLLAVEVDRRAPDGDDIEARRALAPSGHRLAPVFASVWPFRSHASAADCPLGYRRMTSIGEHKFCDSVNSEHSVPIGGDASCFVSGCSAPGASARFTGGNIASSRGGEAGGARRRRRKAAAALAEATGAEVRDADAIIAAGDIDAVLIGTPTDTHADFIEAAARAGKAVLCEKPVDLDLEAGRELPQGGGGGGHPADDRLQPPLRPEFRRAEEAHRRGRDRQGRDRHGDLARPRPAADLLYRALGRPLSRHDDPRFRHRALHARRGAGRGLRLRVVAGRSGDRQGRRRRHGAGDDEDRVRQALRRSPTRGAPPTATTSASRCTARRAWRAPTTSTRPRSRSPASSGFAGDPVQQLLPRALRRRLSARARRLHRRGRQGQAADARAGRDGLAAQRLADAATESRESGKPVAING